MIHTMSDPDGVADRRTDRMRDLSTIAVISIVWAWIIVPKTVQSVLSPKYRNSIGIAQAPYSRLAALADYGLYLGVIAVCVLVILIHLNRIDWYALGSLVCMLAPWAYMVVRDVYAGSPLLDEAVCYPLIVVAVWMIKPDLRRLDVLGYLIGLTSAVSILLALVLPTHAIFRNASGAVVVDDKQIVPGGILVGVFTQGNNLGQFVALGLPAVLLIRNRTHRLVLVTFSTVAVVWSASRGAMLALAVGMVAYAIVRLASPVLRWLLAPLAILVPMVVVCAVPLLTTTDTAFTNRGLVWLNSLKAWRADIWFGQGANWFEVIGSSSSRIAGSVFHGHNQFVQFMVTGGLLFGLLVIPQIAIAIGRATRAAVAGRFFGVAWLAVLIGSCLLEKSFAYVDNANFLVSMVLPFAFLLLSRPVPVVPRPSSDAAIPGVTASRRPPRGSLDRFGPRTPDVHTVSALPISGRPTVTPTRPGRGRPGGAGARPGSGRTGPRGSDQLRDFGAHPSGPPSGRR